MSSRKIPGYCLHKRTGLGYVTLPGPPKATVVYLGQHGTDESRAAYERVIAEWLSRGRQAPPEKAGIDQGATINEIAERFLDHAAGYYQLPSGRPSSELSNIQLSLRPLREGFGFLPVKQFTPLSLYPTRKFRAAGKSGVTGKSGVRGNPVSEHLFACRTGNNDALTRDFPPLTPDFPPDFPF